MAQSLLSAFALFIFITLFPFQSKADFPPFENSVEYMNAEYGMNPRQKFLSNPDLVAPVANLLTTTENRTSPSKYVTWAPMSYMLPAVHPYLLEAETGALVWEGPSIEWQTMGPAIQTCNNSNYITWWSGPGIVDNRSAGRAYIYDDHYQLAYNITTQGVLKYADCHEIYLTPTCTAILTAYETRPYNLTSYNITDGYLLDSYFQEIDLATNEVLFHWQASAVIDVEDAIWLPEARHEGKSRDFGYDFFHMNSVEKDKDGNYLISARHTSSVYLISGINGNVIWTLGGVRNDFTDLSNGLATDFAWQHHARWVDEEHTKISIFDDRSTQFTTSRHNLTRGIIVEIDVLAKTAKLDKSYLATESITAIRQGSMQILADSPQPGNVILGYGNEPSWTEYTADGEVVWDITMGPIGYNRLTADNYRTLKVNFTGYPSWPPSIAAGPTSRYTFDESNEHFEIFRKDHHGAYLKNDTAYFSWNGATEIEYWVLLGSNTSALMNVESNYLDMTDKSGFETSYHVGSAAMYVRALAVAANNTVLGMTSVVEIQSGAIIDSPYNTNCTNATVSEVSVAAADWIFFTTPDTPSSKWDIKVLGLEIAVLVGGICLFLVMLPCLYFSFRRQWLRKQYRRLGLESADDEERWEDQKHEYKSAGISIVVADADIPDFDLAESLFSQDTDGEKCSSEDGTDSANTTLCGLETAGKRSDEDGR